MPFLASLGCKGKCYVAFSGGADSMALLRALADIREDSGLVPHAIHINHGVQPDAERWEQHCADQANHLDLPFTAITGTKQPTKGSGPEDRWRQLRLTAFESLMKEEDVVCTAHHLSDQAETLLLNLFRGSGIDGWAAMPRIRSLGRGRLVRPLLEVSRDSLLAYLKSTGLKWIEDPSNEDTRFDRNFLRQEVMPLLEQRWPAVQRTLFESTQRAAEARLIVQTTMESNIAERTPCPGVLDLGGLAGEKPFLKQLIRFWLNSEGHAPLPGSRLESFVDQILDATSESKASVAWDGHVVRWYDHSLWMDMDQPEDWQAVESWTGTDTVRLGAVAGEFELDPPRDLGRFRLHRRTGGERFSLCPEQNSRSLKEWFRQAGLPYWYRNQVPLLFEQADLVAIGDHPVSESLLEKLAKQHSRLIWRPGDNRLNYAWRRCSDRMQGVK